MTLEEILIKYQHAFPENTEVWFSIRRKLNSVYCEFSIEGAAIDALHSEINSDDPENPEILNYIFNIGFGDAFYHYKSGKNIISISMRYDVPVVKFLKKPMIQAVFFGLLVGLLLRLLFPNQAETISNDYIAPLYSLLMDVLRGITEPVIFISLVAGICAVGSLQKMKEISNSILLSFFKISALMFVISVSVCSLAYAHQGGVGKNYSFQQMFNIVLGSVPTDIFKPFIDSNIIQIVILAFVSGIILLTLDNKVAGIKKLVIEFKTFFQV